MDSLNAAFVPSLKMGDQFYSDGLFIGLADKQVKWEVVDQDGPMVKFLHATYFGVSLGDFKIVVTRSGKVKLSVFKK